MKSLFVLFLALAVAAQVTARSPPKLHKPRIRDHVNDILCDTCTELVTEFEALLKSLDEDEIVSTLTGICDDLQLPGNMSAECKELVKEYVPEIFEMIDSMDPQTLCTEMSLCTEKDVMTTKPRVTKLGKNSPKYHHNSFRRFTAIDRLFVSAKERIQQNVVRRLVEQIFDDNVVCEGCKQTVQFIHDLLTDNETVSDIVSALEMVCHYLPEEFQKSCDDYIELLPEVLATIANTYFMPEEDCQAVGLCPGEDEVIVPEIPGIPEILIPDIPELSKLPEIPSAFETIYNLPKMNKHKKRLSFKPKRFQRSIHKFKIKNKTRKLPTKIQDIATKYDKVPSVEQVERGVMTETMMETPVKTNTNETWECSLCAHLVKTLSAFVNKHRDTFADAVIEGTTTFCERLPEPFATTCSDEVTPYLKKALVELAFAYYLTPDNVCPRLVDNCSP